MKKKLWGMGIVMLCVVLNIDSNSAAMADEEEEKYEEQQFLFMMEEAYTQEKGEWQAGFTSQYLDGKKSREVEHEDGEREDKLKIKDEWQWIAEIEYGVVDWLQLEVEIPFVYVDKRTIKESENGGRTVTDLKSTGIGDISGGIGIRLLKEDVDKWWFPTISTGFEVIFPTGNWKKDLGTDKFGWEAKIALSKAIDQFVIHLTGAIGITNNAREEGEAGEKDVKEFEYGAALVYRPEDRLDFIFEAFAEFEEEESEGNKNYETEFHVTPGVRYELFEDFEIGAGIPIGLTHESYDWGFITKVQYEW